MKIYWLNVRPELKKNTETPDLKYLQLFLRVRKIYLIGLFLGAAGVFSPAIAQEEERQRPGSRVIDDTTRQVYGPATSQYFFEQDIFFNQTVLHPIDTVIRNFHRFTYVQKNENLYQDLGNIGTAARPVFYQVPSYIGVSTGYESFDLYWEAPRIRYFDTKSPYVNMKLALGKVGRSLTNVSYTRNINPRWNFGFDYRGIFVDKQIQRTGKGDRNVRSTYYDLFTTYYSKDSSYRVFANFARNMYQVYEFGGVQQRPDVLSDLFRVNAQPFLTRAESRELRMRFHLFHQYEVGRAFQLYHQMDRDRQGNQFFDVIGQGSYDYDAVVVPGDSTHERTTLRTFRNEAGIKGNIFKIFYNGYVASRHYSMHYRYGYGLNPLNIPIPVKDTEYYLGGRMALQLDSLMELRGWAEVLADQNYRIEATLSSKWIEASLKQNQYKAPFIYQAYRGAHDLWENSFSDTEVTQLNGYLHYRSSTVNLSPGLTFTRLRNYVFFDHNEAPPAPADTVQEVLPIQSSGNQIVFSPEVKLSLTFFRHVTLSTRAIYTNLLENADEAMRVPEIFVNSQVSYQNIFFRGNLDMHAGVDFHWHSAYMAPAYDQVIQQFYNQDFYEVPAFPVVDIFFNAKIKRGRIFVKYHNLLQRFSPYGYIPTPYYPGQQGVIDFGFDWSFYD